MVTHYPQMSSGESLSLAEHTHRADDGIGARMLAWIGRAYCGLHGHDSLMHFEKDRMFLQCASCGHATPGWELTEQRPMMSVRAARRTHVLHRPRLVSARRIA
jgi:hypothetical protein